MTNDRASHGAAAVLYENVLKQFADGIDRDLFILPSSIHELLLVPYEKISVLRN
jgi:hypothetical protein